MPTIGDYYSIMEWGLKVHCKKTFPYYKALATTIRILPSRQNKNNPKKGLFLPLKTKIIPLYLKAVEGLADKKMAKF